MYAASSPSPSLVHVLLSRGADVKASDEHGRTALSYAVKEETDNLEIIRVLLAKSDVNQPDEAGETPLMMVAMTKQPEVVLLLLNRGVQVNASCPDTGTVLYSLHNVGVTEKVTADQEHKLQWIRSLLKQAGAREFP